jgi:hypothetical protein
MPDFFSAYKPYRNYIARFPLLSNLVRLWGYGRYIVEGRPLQRDLGIGRPPFTDLRRYLHPWDIEILVRELLLHGELSLGADSHNRPDFANWSSLGKAVNQLRKLEDHPFSGDQKHLDVILHLNRVAYRQFRWQGSAVGLAPSIRALKIYGGTELDSITQESFGMTMLQLVRLSFAVSGHLLDRWDFNTDTDFEELGISRTASRAYFDLISCEIPKLRKALLKQQRYDDGWAYTWNPLEATPLIRVDSRHPNRVICPIPRYALLRGTTGIFYDVVKKLGFDNKYGASFQSYVGELLRLACPNPAFSVDCVKPFSNKKGKLMHGPDWILSDASAHLVIECKTKRMSLGAKQLSDMEALDKDIDAIAEAVVQTYKNIRSANQGEIAWRPERSQIFPMVVTLEDWYLLSPQITTMLQDKILRKLTDESIDAGVLESMPFMIVSANDLELGAQVIAQTSIAEVLGKAVSIDRRFWTLHHIIAKELPDQLRKVKPILFENDARTIVPNSSQAS